MMDADPEGFELEQKDLAYWAYEYAYKDGRINVSSLVNDLEIPTIGVINGPGFHTEMCLMCDLTICAEDAVLYDLHYDIGSVPGDGIHSCFQELLGVKRAAYALLTGQAIDAKTALEYGQGLVYEVMNMAALWKLPVIYACENNLYGEYTKVDEMAAGSITARAEAFGIEAHVVDGQDVLAVNRITWQLVERARRGEGPFFLQLNTYRFHGHHVGDINRDYYRTKEEETFWKTERDPILLFGH
jgi:enoyl-CoA hydratase/carnithine racemase